MFDRLSEALRGFTSKVASVASMIEEKAAYRTVGRGELDPLLDELLYSLVESDVSIEAAEFLVDSVREALVDAKIRRGEDLRVKAAEALRAAMEELLKASQPPASLVDLARRSCDSGRPFVAVFLGVNGVGKTTSIAKVAYKLRSEGLTPVVAAADTFRAGAQEQLALHAERIGVPLVKGRYGSDPASVAFDAIRYASARGFCAVLIDTAGRMHVDRNLVDELKKIVRVARPDLKLLVVDALTGNDAVEQARTFNEHVGVDGVIIAKLDADPKGGTLVSVAYAIRKPIYYMGTGQGYGDLQEFSFKRISNMILGAG